MVSLAFQVPIDKFLLSSVDLLRLASSRVTIRYLLSKSRINNANRYI